MALIPADRLTDWTPATRTGSSEIDTYLPGGEFADYLTDPSYHTDVTASPYFADNTGATVCLTAVQAAMDATGNIYFPAGTYDFGGSRVTINPAFSNVWIVGSGSDSATIVNGGFVFGASDGWDNITPQAISAGMTQDSTEITVADSTDFAAGKLMLICFADQNDDAEIEAGAVAVVSYTGWNPANPLRRQVVRIVSKDGNDITFSPGIYHAPSKTTGVAKTTIYTMSNVRMAHFKIDNDDAPALATAIEIRKGNQCWMYDVEIANFANYAVESADSLRTEIRYCNFHDRHEGGTNGSAILLNTVSGFLIWDNILRNSQPLLEVNAGSCGGVFAFNLCENDTSTFGIVTNHGPHNSHNLYEGNIASNIISDAYFGSESEPTACRNWFHGTDYTDSYFGFEVGLKRFTQTASFVGNILGKNEVYLGDFTLGEPNIGSSQYDLPTFDLSADEFPVDWKMTGTLITRTNDTSGVIELISGSMRASQTTAYINSGGYYQILTGSTLLTGIVDPPNNVDAVYAGGTFSFTTGGGTLPDEDTVLSIWPGTYGFQQLDDTVESELVNKGNYLYGSGGSAGSMSSLGGDTLPDSLFLSEKPTWFGNLNWPPFDPTSPNSSSYEGIPAGYRWINGDDPPGSGDTSFDGSGSTTFTGSGSVTFA